MYIFDQYAYYNDFNFNFKFNLKHYELNAIKSDLNLKDAEIAYIP